MKTIEKIKEKPMPRMEINPGLVSLLLRENIAEEVMIKSPYKTHKGVTVRTYAY